MTFVFTKPEPCELFTVAPFILSPFLPFCSEVAV